MNSSQSNSPKNRDTVAASSGTAAAPSSRTAGDAAWRDALGRNLRGHITTTAAAVDAALGQGTNSPEFRQASAKVKANLVEIAQAVQGVYGQSAAAQFLSIWGPHTGYFVDYGLGRKRGDEARLARARSGLRLYRMQTVQLLTKLSPKLPAGALDRGLREHIASVEALIDARLSGSPAKKKELLRRAEDRAAAVADTLARAIRAA